MAWTIAPPQPRADAPEVLQVAFAQYARAQVQDHLPDDDDHVPEPHPPDVTALHAADAPLHLWRTVRATLRLRLARKEFTTWFASASLHAVTHDVATLMVPTLAIKRTIEQRSMALIQEVITQEETAITRVHVMVHGAPGSNGAVLPVPEDRMAGIASAVNPAHPHTPEPCRRPEWISPTQWNQLSAHLRAVLIGATLTDGRVHAAAPQLQHLLDHQDAFVIAALVAGSKSEHTIYPMR